MEDGPYIKAPMYWPSSDVWIASIPMYGPWTLRCMDPLMVTDVNVFQVADAPTNGYVYTLPNLDAHGIICLLGNDQKFWVTPDIVIWAGDRKIRKQLSLKIWECIVFGAKTLHHYHTNGPCLPWAKVKSKHVKQANCYQQHEEVKSFCIKFVDHKQGHI